MSLICMNSVCSIQIKSFSASTILTYKIIWKIPYIIDYPGLKFEIYRQPIVTVSLSHPFSLFRGTIAIDTGTDINTALWVLKS